MNDGGAGIPPKDITHLLKAIGDVMAEIGAVKKAGYNAFHKYKYAMEADVIHEVRPAFLRHNILLIPSVTNCTTQVVNDNILTTATISYRLIHIPSGEALEYTIVGQGMDKGDKGIYKALTGANKYAILKPLLVATGDDPEKDESTDRNNNGEAPIRRRANYTDFPKKKLDDGYKYIEEAAKDPIETRLHTTVNKKTGEIKDEPKATPSQEKLLRVLVAERDVSLKTMTEIDDLMQQGKLSKRQANIFINELSGLPKTGGDDDFPPDIPSED